MFLYLIGRIPAGIVGFESDDVLRLRPDTHCVERAIVKKRLNSGGCLCNSYPSASGILFQFKDDTCLLGKFNPFESLDRLMVLHHLHRSHVLIWDVVGRKSVLPSYEVVAVKIELVDGLSLILYCSVFFHLDAGQSFDDIDNRIVLCIGIFGDIEHQCITFGIYVGSLYYHVIELRGFRSETDTRKVCCYG